jgi:peptidoglycan/LPS O-acetylase OafA/YrhL
MLNSQLVLSHPKYRPDIDGLRAAAVIFVVIFHAFPEWIKGGFIGVDIFFVISGFLISTIIFENLDRGTFSFSEFYARRVKRIFPALLLVLISVLVFGWFVLLADEYMQLGKHVASGAGFISNIILWGEAGYFDNSAETKPLLHLWSLGIEEQFYIVWPLLLWFAWKQKFNLITIIVLVASISLYLNITNIKNDAVATFYSPQTRFWELLCGSLLAWVTLYCKSEAVSSFKYKVDGWLAFVIYREKINADGKTLANFFSFAGLALLIYGFYKIDEEGFPGAWAIIPVLGAMLIIAGSGAWINRTILSTRIFIWFGVISYPLYLWHWPLFSFARIMKNETPSVAIRVGLIVLSIVLAWLTYKLIESPIRFGASNKSKVIVMIVLMTLVGGTGYYIFKKDGLASVRFNNSEASLINATLPKYSTEYTPYRFNELIEKEFDLKDPRRKILIIGDSYAQDLVNALFESGFDSSLQMTTRMIKKECGNLFIRQSDFIKHINIKSADLCNQQRIFEDKLLHKRMQEADEI